VIFRLVLLHIELDAVFTHPLRSARVESPNSTDSRSNQTEPHGGEGNAYGPTNKRCQASDNVSSASALNFALSGCNTSCGKGHWVSHSVPFSASIKGAASGLSGGR
jgi:hypothetical protein